VPLAALLNTNVWVSAFLKPNGPPGKVVAAWADDQFSVVTSLLQLSEIADVLNRPRLVRRFRYPHRDAEAFVRLIAARATGELQVCRAPDDDQIVEAAIGGKARYLITNARNIDRMTRGVAMIFIRISKALLTQVATRSYIGAYEGGWSKSPEE
jgi:putative PIN family toxin of toxin-antitoxin system